MNQICSIFLLLLSLQKIIAVLDLNRTPSPEPPEERNPPIPIAQAKPTRENITKLKRSPTSPGVQANAKAVASGYPKNSKEYKKIYYHHYHTIRRQQKEKFFEGRVENPKLALEQEKQRKNESIRNASAARTQRKRAGTLTPADKWYYERSARWQRELYEKNPGLKRKRNTQAIKRRKARLAEEKEKANKEHTTEDK